jgi:peptide/nickel transport system ATP-binding protein
MKGALLHVENLSVHYLLPEREKVAVKNATFTVFPDEVFGLVGESGSGKSTLCYGLLQLVPPPGKIVSGKAFFQGENLLGLQGEALRKKRWREIAFIPQGAMSVLNPVTRIGEQFADVLEDHGAKIQTRAELTKTIADSLRSVNLPGDVARKFPHELSGGMKQRVCIALAVLLNPALILADEPTSALDVVSQRIVLEMLSEVRKRLEASMILVGHDMALQAQIADRIGIMFDGCLLEIGPAMEIFSNPLHPYTRRLISSIPSITKKQDIHTLAQEGYDESEKRTYTNFEQLVEVHPGHWVAR